MSILNARTRRSCLQLVPSTRKLGRVATVFDAPVSVLMRMTRFLASLCAVDDGAESLLAAAEAQEE